MSIRYKLLIVLLVAVLLPMLVSLTVSKIYSGRTQNLTSEATNRLASADVNHIITGALSLVSANKTAIDRQREEAIKTYLRSAADTLYYQVSKIEHLLPRDQAWSQIRKTMLAPKFGQTGYAFGMNSKGTLTIHPKSEGKNLAGKKHIDEMIANKEGYISYVSATTGRKKSVFYRYYAPLDLIIAPGAFSDEMTSIADLDAELDAIDQLQNQLRKIKIGNKGFVWVIAVDNEADNTGDFIVTPFDDDIDKLDLLYKDANGNEYIPQLVKTALSAPANAISSEERKLIHPADGQAQEMLLSYSYYKPLRWIVGTALPKGELTATSDLIAASFSKMNLAVLISTLILLGLAGIFAWIAATRAIKPIRSVQNMAMEMSLGHLDNRLHMNRSDEIGQMANAMDDFADDLQNQVVEALKRLGNGDLTFAIEPKDNQDQIRGAIKKLVVDLNQMMAQILTAGDQIDSGSHQISDSAQSLSLGASKSAAALEQIGASISQMADQTKHSAQNAGQANSLSTGAVEQAQNGNQQMEAMVRAMDDIKASGESISRIIKVIDEIAFQTNLLALNAAVEAARAGQHGKGFAVVAEEVRNLAARSAKAAEETTGLIESSVEKTNNGAQIADQTAAALNEIVESVTKVSDLVHGIATASNEQAQGISQINQGLEQIDQVIQQNTAAAEESAATSEELSSQASYLKEMLSRFKLNQQQQSPQAYESQPEQLAMTPVDTGGQSFGGDFIIRWKDSLCTGISRVDEQHQKLVALINQLFRCMKDGGDRMVLAQVVDELTSYTVTHFRDEEELMRQHNYPDLENHKSIHELFVNKVSVAAEKLKAGERVAPADLYNFLKGWLVNHIEEQDRDGFAPYIKNRP